MRELPISLTGKLNQELLLTRICTAISIQRILV